MSLLQSITVTMLNTTMRPATKMAIPANISPEEARTVQNMAKTVFTALELYGMARIDMFMEKTTRQIFFNEVNTIPGFTQISRNIQCYGMPQA